MIAIRRDDMIIIGVTASDRLLECWILIKESRRVLGRVVSLLDTAKDNHHNQNQHKHAAANAPNDDLIPWLAPTSKGKATIGTVDHLAIIIIVTRIVVPISRRVYRRRFRRHNRIWQFFACIEWFTPRQLIAR